MFTALLPSPTGSSTSSYSLVSPNLLPGLSQLWSQCKPLSQSWGWFYSAAFHHIQTSDLWNDWRDDWREMKRGEGASWPINGWHLYTVCVRQLNNLAGVHVLITAHKSTYSGVTLKLATDSRHLGVNYIYSMLLFVIGQKFKFIIFFITVYCNILWQSGCHMAVSDMLVLIKAEIILFFKSSAIHGIFWWGQNIASHGLGLIFDHSHSIMLSCLNHNCFM